MGRMDRVYRPGVGFTPSDARHTLRPAAADQNRAQQQRSLQPCQAQTCLAQPARAPPATGHHQGGRGDQRARAFAHARGYQFARRGAGERIALAATALTTAAATISPTAFASTLSATILSIAAALSTAAAAAALLGEGGWRSTEEGGEATQVMREADAAAVDAQQHLVRVRASLVVACARHVHGMCTARARHVHGTCTARAWRMHGMWGASPAAARAWRERAAAPQAARALPRSRCGHRSCRRSRPPGSS